MIAAGVVAGLIIGFLVGIAVDYPKVEDEELAGTITKVDKYRNIKVSETDIRLQNDLVSDTASLRVLRNYITYHYLDAIQIAGNISKAVTEANGAEAFKAFGTRQIKELNSYGAYLASTRGYFLAALAAVRDAKNTDPALIRNSLNQINNVIAQKNYRSRVVVDFINQAESFLASNKSGDYEGLRQAHDILAVDMVNASLITGDKVMQKFLGKKPLLTDYRKLRWYDHDATMKQVQHDIEQMGAWSESEKLRIVDAEKLGVLDAEKMGVVIADAEKLGALDAEKMGMAADAEKMGYYYLDAQQLGLIGNIEQLAIFDSEKLGPFIITDADKMGEIFFDSELIGFLVADAEKMGEIMNAEKMGTIIVDAEKMGIILDAEKMGIIRDAEKMGYVLDADKLGIYMDADKMGMSMFDAAALGSIR